MRSVEIEIIRKRRQSSAPSILTTTLPGFLLLIGFILCLTIPASTASFQENHPAGSVQKDSTGLEKDTLRTNFSLSQSDLHSLGDYDLTRWVNHLPHIWVSHSDLYGQPQTFQGIATPLWMSRIEWNDMPMNDPIYGYFDLNFLPAVVIDTMTATGIPGDLKIQNEHLATSRPYSQVFYHHGDYGLSEVDVLFRRGFKGGVAFKMGGNFFKYKGPYISQNGFNQAYSADYDNLKLNAELVIPVSSKMKLSYHILHNRIESGYPGAAEEREENGQINYALQFDRLHRKVRRQDHYFDFDYSHSKTVHGKLTFLIHSDNREYTDWTIPLHLKEDLFWVQSNARLIKTQGGSETAIGLTSAAIFSGRSNENDLHEIPVGLTFSRKLSLPGQGEILSKARITYFNKRWQTYFAEISTVKQIKKTVTFTSSAFYRQQVYPLGWRNGRILPFENQPWPLLFPEKSYHFISENVPEKPVIQSGLHLKINYHRSRKIDFYADFLLHQVQNLSYPQGLKTEKILFVPVPAYYATGVYLNLNIRVFSWLSLSGRYQYSGIFYRQTPALIEIPDHWYFWQIHICKYLFQNNLKANFFLYNEFFSQRRSYGIDLGSEYSRYILEPFPAIPLLHAKFLFEIGDAEIFIHWNNLTNQNYGYRSRQRIRGWQFQFGVRWTFWD